MNNVDPDIMLPKQDEINPTKQQSLKIDYKVNLDIPALMAQHTRQQQDYQEYDSADDMTYQQRLKASGHYLTDREVETLVER